MIPERERKAEEFRQWKANLDSRAPQPFRSAPNVPPQLEHELGQANGYFGLPRDNYPRVHNSESMYMPSKYPLMLIFGSSEDRLHFTEWLRDNLPPDLLKGDKP